MKGQGLRVPVQMDRSNSAASRPQAVTVHGGVDQLKALVAVAGEFGSGWQGLQCVGGGFDQVSELLAASDQIRWPCVQIAADQQHAVTTIKPH